MSERRITGQQPHLVADDAARASSPDYSPTLTPDEIDKKPKPSANAELDLLPRRFDFFVSEVRDFMSSMTREARRVARIESELVDARTGAGTQWSALHGRIDSVEKKLDRILAVLEKPAA